jgi:hypothetical protein
MCGLDDYYEVTLAGDGEYWLYTCNAPGHSPYTWQKPVATRPVGGREGVMAEFGLYDDLLSCFDPSDRRWIEHGVIEHRYLLSFPRTYFDYLLPRWGHASDRSATGKSTSLLLAQAMGQLRREGLLEYRTWRPTGFWSKNSTISYWATPPGPDDESRLAWQEYATENGIEPSEWEFHAP